MSVKHGFGVDLAQDALLALARQWPTALKLSVVPLITSFLGSTAIVGAFIALQFNISSQPAFPYDKRDFLVTFIAIALTLQFCNRNGHGAVNVGLVSTYSGTVRQPLDSIWTPRAPDLADLVFVRCAHPRIGFGARVWCLSAP